MAKQLERWFVIQINFFCGGPKFNSLTTLANRQLASLPVGAQRCEISLRVLKNIS